MRWSIVGTKLNKTAYAQGTADQNKNGSLVSSLASHLLSKMAADDSSFLFFWEKWAWFGAGSSNWSLVECGKILVVIEMIQFWLGVHNTASCCFLNMADWVNYLLMIIISSNLCQNGLHQNKSFLSHLCVYRVIFGSKFGDFLFFLPAVTLWYEYQFSFTLKVGVIIFITNILQLHSCFKKRDWKIEMNGGEGHC